MGDRERYEWKCRMVDLCILPVVVGVLILGWLLGR